MLQIIGHPLQHLQIVVQVLHEGVGLIGVACLITPRLFHRSSHHHNDHHISFIILTAAPQSQICENNR